MKTCNAVACRATESAQPFPEFAPLVLERVDPLDLSGQRETLEFVFDYLNSERNRGALAPRPTVHYQDAFARGDVVRGRRSGVTVFCAMGFLYRGGSRVYVEVGSVLNTDHQRGLMEPVVRAMVARAFQTWPDATVFAVARPRSASAHVLGKVGMRSSNPPAELRRLRAEAGVPFSSHKEVFVMKF